MHVIIFTKDYPVTQKDVKKKGEKLSCNTAKAIELVKVKKVAKYYVPKVKQVAVASTSQPINVDEKIKALKAEHAKEVAKDIETIEKLTEENLKFKAENLELKAEIVKLTPKKK